MTGSGKSAHVIDGIEPDRIPFDDLFARNEPVLLRGLVSGWALVESGRQSLEQALEYMADGYSGRPVRVYVGDPAIKARFGYNELCTGLNYRAETMNLLDVFRAIREDLNRSEHPYYYINSLTYEEGFPGLRTSNDLVFNHEVFDRHPRISRIWIGTESRASAHYDMSSNMACCAVGGRRFTLFPPDQVHNLYPGPLAPTPGGQVITMVDLKEPDFDAYPRFRKALEQSVVVDMEPGDVLYYPSMWWHEVEAKDRFNVMINYWWNTSPRYMGNPVDVVMHAILGLRDRPQAEKQAWRELFDYYVFGSAEKPRAHLPKACLGPLGEMDDTLARRLRALVQQNLNR